MKEIKKVFKAVATNGDEVIEFESFNHREPITNLLFEILSRKYNTTFEYKTITNLRKKENISSETKRKAMWIIEDFKKQSAYNLKGKFNPCKNGFDFESFRIVVSVKEVEVEVEKKILRPMEEFNGYTPQESLDYIKSLIDPFECNDERLSDAIKRLQVLIDEAK